MANHRLRPIQMLDLASGHDYDEETFRYFLSMEQARAARANQPLRLLLATLDGHAGRSSTFPPPMAAQVFQALRHALRDTDVIGWYQQDRVAGAVLTLPLAEADHIAHLERRVIEGAKRRLPAVVAARLRVRVVRRERADLVLDRGTA